MKVERDIPLPNRLGAHFVSRYSAHVGIVLLKHKNIIISHAQSFGWPKYQITTLFCVYSIAMNNFVYTFIIIQTYYNTHAHTVLTIDIIIRWRVTRDQRPSSLSNISIAYSFFFLSDRQIHDIIIYLLTWIILHCTHNCIPNNGLLMTITNEAVCIFYCLSGWSIFYVLWLQINVRWYYCFMIVIV